jgi:hypothetical protein
VCILLLSLLSVVPGEVHAVHKQVSGMYDVS